MNISKYTKPVRKLLPLRRCGAVIVAAGSASRMGGIDKVMAPLKGEPMIVHTVRAFQECDAIAEIVVVTRPDLILPITKLTNAFDKVTAVVSGGASRQESVALGMNAPRYLATHRPGGPGGPRLPRRHPRDPRQGHHQGLQLRPGGLHPGPLHPPGRPDPPGLRL